jgi:hypothetical protein
VRCLEHLFEEQEARQKASPLIPRRAVQGGNAGSSHLGGDIAAYAQWHQVSVILGKRRHARRCQLKNWLAKQPTFKTFLRVLLNDIRLL